MIIFYNEKKNEFIEFSLEISTNMNEFLIFI